MGYREEDNKRKVAVQLQDIEPKVNLSEKAWDFNNYGKCPLYYPIFNPCYLLMI